MSNSKHHVAIQFLFAYVNTITAGLIVLLLIVYNYLVRWFAVAKKPQPPKPAGAWPLLGHLPLFAGCQQLPHIMLGDLADKYGPIFTLHIGARQALVVSSWEVAKELFTTNDIALADRPSFTAAKYLSYDGAMFGFAPYGDYWREMRKLITMELLSSRQLESLKHVRVSEIENFLKELHVCWMEKRIGSNHVVVDLKQRFSDLNLNLILRLVVGKRYAGTAGGGDGKEAERCHKAIESFFHLTGVFVLRDAIPFLGWLDVGGYEKVMKRTAKELDELVSEWLEEHRSKRNSEEVANEEHDFMTLMLSVLEGSDHVGCDSDTINKSTCLNLILGASETTTIVLTWTISLLLNNKITLKKAQEELDMMVGRERKVNESDISKLIYLQAIIKEALRLCPPAPLSGPREIRENCTISGYHVKKGTWLFTNLWKIHTDPRIWPDSLEFKPERFLTSHKHIDVRGQNFELIPFGSGRRACPGTSFGLQMVATVLASFLQAFEISNPTSAPIDMTGKFGMTNMKATPLEVLLSPRLSPEFYNW
ncbi:cytochrome P450 CYP82D47 [Manihot esculenta]|uniref:Cytochrome P450 n=1 Tax=Manihot esculenta TaxID=3983 RepID=A0A2C9VWY2_MANES|nr:cytochrome P450 CYP82D47 [Manihot esculenta]OAY50855.1 hypothetical protein MANES_05G167700v8 [Manihot esculenta]